MIRKMQPADLEPVLNFSLGLIGLDGDYIAGLFVAPEAQAQGIGKQLLDYAKSLRSQLTLRVYQQNERALRFYQREGFQIENEQIDEATGAAEYLMHWQAY